MDHSRVQDKQTKQIKQEEPDVQAVQEPPPRSPNLLENTCSEDFSLLLYAIYDVGGVKPALRFLNGMSGFRYTGLYHVQGQTLCNDIALDRQDPSLDVLAPLPIVDSYCVHVLATGQAFTVQDSHTDERVADHPKKNVVRSYCGVPVFGQHGHSVGTICHFDPEPQRQSPADVGRLTCFAEMVSGQPARARPI